MTEFEQNEKKNAEFIEAREFPEVGRFGGGGRKKRFAFKQKKDLSQSIKEVAKGMAVAAAGIIIVESAFAMTDPEGFSNDMNSGIGGDPSPSSVRELIASEDHIWSDEGIVIKEATCKEKGILRFICKICGLEKDEDIPLADHTPSEEEGVEATCTEHGHSGDLVCSVCGELLEEGSDTDPLGHDWGPKNTIRNATCTATGLQREVCLRCGEQRDSVIAALGHDSAEEVVIVEASCAEGGLVEIRCSRCGEVVGERETAALGHHWGEEMLISEATCTEDGYYGRICNVCEEIEETSVIPALGHADGEIVVVTAATCTASGTSEVRCSRCGEVLETIEAAALGHDWGETIIVTEATCESEGSMKQICLRCGEEQYGVILQLEHHDDDGDYKCDRCGNALLDIYVASGSKGDGEVEATLTISPVANGAEPNDNVWVSASSDTDVIRMEVVQNSPSEVQVYLYYDTIPTEDFIFSITIFVDPGTGSGSIEVLTKQFVLSADHLIVEDYYP